MEYCHGRMPEDGTTKVTEPAAEKDQGLRADCYLADVLDLSRSSLQHDMEKDLSPKKESRSRQVIRSSWGMSLRLSFRLL